MSPDLPSGATPSPPDRWDPSLELPEPPPLGPPLEGPSGDIVIAGPASGRPFVLTAPRIRAEGVETRGLDLVLAAERVLLASLRATPDAPASNVLVSPRSTRREVVAPGSGVIETILLCERHAALVVEWIRSGGGSARLRFDVPVRALRIRGEGPTLRVDGVDGRVRLYHVAPEPGPWDVSGEEVRVETRGAPERGPQRGPERDPERVMGSGRGSAAGSVPAEERRTILLAAEGKDLAEATAALHAAARTRVEEARSLEAARRATDELLRLETGVTDLDQGLAWAQARLEEWPGDEAPVGELRAPGLARALHLLALLAAGRHEEAGPALARMPVVRPASLLAAGWYARWTGRPPAELPATRLRIRIEALIDGPPRGSQIDEAIHRAALSSALDLLEIVAGEGAARALRDRAAGAPVLRAGPGSGAGMSLPVVGGRGRSTAEGEATGAGAGAALERLLAGVASVGPPRRTPAVLPLPDAVGAGAPRALHAWAAYDDLRPGEAYPLLRAHLAEWTRAVPGAWPAPPGSVRPDDPVAAALTPVALVYGLLGVRPDASVGRIRLAPAPPPAWTSFDVRGLRVGDVTLDLGYRREATLHTFVLRPTAGAVPPNVVFEPLVAGPVEDVEVDGEATGIEGEPVGGGTPGWYRARLQLPVDRERRVTLVGRPS